MFCCTQLLMLFFKNRNAVAKWTLKCDLFSLDIILVVRFVLELMSSDDTSLFWALWQASRSSQSNSRPHAQQRTGGQMVMPRCIIHSKTQSPELAMLGPFNSLKECQNEAEDGGIFSSVVCLFLQQGPAKRFSKAENLKKKVKAAVLLIPQGSHFAFSLRVRLYVSKLAYKNSTKKDALEVFVESS